MSEEAVDNTKLIKDRQAIIRRWMLQDRYHNQAFEILITVPGMGGYVERRWFTFGQIALYNNGASLTDDSVWDDVQAEMKIPSILWADGINRSVRAGSDAQQVLRLRSYEFPITAWGNNIRVRKASWWTDKMRRIDYIDVLAWLGLIGGELLPEAPAEEASLEPEAPPAEGSGE